MRDDGLFGDDDSGHVERCAYPTCTRTAGKSGYCTLHDWIPEEGDDDDGGNVVALA